MCAEQQGPGGDGITDWAPRWSVCHPRAAAATPWETCAGPTHHPASSAARCAQPRPPPPRAAPPSTGCSSQEEIPEPSSSLELYPL